MLQIVFLSQDRFSGNRWLGVHLKWAITYPKSPVTQHDVGRIPCREGTERLPFLTLFLRGWSSYVDWLSESLPGIDRGGLLPMFHRTPCIRTVRPLWKRPLISYIPVVYDVRARMSTAPCSWFRLGEPDNHAKAQI